MPYTSPRSIRLIFEGSSPDFVSIWVAVATGFEILLIGLLQRPTEQGGFEWSIIQTANYLSWLYLAGIFVVLFARETNKQDLLE